MESSQIVHEVIMIMKDNQYQSGMDSNKTTVIRIEEFLEGAIKENKIGMNDGNK